MRQLSHCLVLAGVLILAGCATTPGAEDSAEQTTPQSDLDYHLLLAEIARERQQYRDAARHYTDAALLSDDPRIAEQATLIAFEIGLNDVGLSPPVAGWSCRTKTPGYSVSWAPSSCAITT